MHLQTVRQLADGEDHFVWTPGLEDRSAVCPVTIMLIPIQRCFGLLVRVSGLGFRVGLGFWALGLRVISAIMSHRCHSYCLIDVELVGFGMLEGAD